MSLTKEEIDRIYDIKKRLDLTYKSTSNKIQRIRLKKEIENIDSIIQDINDGKWVNPLKVKLFSSSKSINNTNEGKINNNEINYNNVIITKIKNNSHDPEMDIIYSYFNFFDENFYPLLSLKNLKLRFDTGKKRDDILQSYDLTHRQFLQYIKDLENISNSPTNTKEQINHRINTEKYSILVRIEDFFQKLQLLVKEINKGLALGEKIVLNPDEKYFDHHNIANYGIFEGIKIFEIFIELEIFLDIFLSKFSIPDFLRGHRK